MCSIAIGQMTLLHISGGRMLSAMSAGPLAQAASNWKWNGRYEWRDHAEQSVAEHVALGREVRTDTKMTKWQRAAQIWSVLTLCATRRQTLTYDLLGRLIGVPRQGLGQLLEPIQSYCILNRLEPLTVLVVSDVSGLPGEGFVAASDVPGAQARVFARDLLSLAAPDENALEAACRALPSKGRSLCELEEVLRKSEQ
jgi:hypothetical protein